ncbi:MAG: DNA repair protein RecN [Firmicutes bacterium]|nr:DNA repair protein RecN [Bacillota bacterium]
MLLELNIQNVALIEQLRLNFSRGLNVLTGETGAGKSIIIDAVSLLLGGRASVDYIRTNEDRAVVEGVFQCQGHVEVSRCLHELGIELEEDGTLILLREITRTGRNICRVNGRTVPLSVYRELGQNLVEIHGQHENQRLLNSNQHLPLLDNFGGGELLGLVNELQGIYRAIGAVRKELERWTGNEKEVARRLDLLQYQIEEIDAARLRVDEELQLENERTRLMYAEKLASQTERAYQYIFAGGKQQAAAFDLIGRAVAELRGLVGIDPSLNQILENLESTQYLLEDMARELRTYRENIEFNPQRLDAVEQRLELIRQLKRKYGDSIQEILRYRTEAVAEREEIRRSGDKITALSAELQRLEQEFADRATILSARRKEAARRLEVLIKRELSDLAMESTQFQVSLRLRQNWTSSGYDEVEFLISPNPGEQPRPLSKIASGGELSRIMLAIKTILAGVDGIPTLIFDEIDTGIGGRALQGVALKLEQVARDCQVICVTHAPQIASFAETHFCITKEVQGERTRTQVRALTADERVEEIARMLGGAEVTPLTRQHAREMLQLARSANTQAN